MQTLPEFSSPILPRPPIFVVLEHLAI
jgi:hypothetical protein